MSSSRTQPSWRATHLSISATSGSKEAGRIGEAQIQLCEGGSLMGGKGFMPVMSGSTENEGACQWPAGAMKTRGLSVGNTVY